MKPALSQLLRGATGGRPISRGSLRMGISCSFQGEIRALGLLKSLNSLYRPALSGIGGAVAASSLPKGLLGRSQVVRQRILIPPFGGSIPPAPAISNTLNSLPKWLCSRATFERIWKWFFACHLEILCCFRFHRMLREARQIAESRVAARRSSCRTLGCALRVA